MLLALNVVGGFMVTTICDVGGFRVTTMPDVMALFEDTILKKSGVIYKYSCGRVDCGEEYIGESGRTFGERYREHMRSPSPIMDHHNTTGHEVSLDNFTIVGREDNNITRNIREAIFIRVNDPSLNRNIGKFQLLHIWDEVLARSPELHLKKCHNIWHGGNPKPTNITNGGNHKPTNHI